MKCRDGSTYMEPRQNPQENPYKFYLLAELSKFKDGNEVDDLFAKTESQDREEVNLPSNKQEIVFQFRNKSSVIEFTEGLSNEQFKKLTQFLSNWRRNGVYDEIQNAGTNSWVVETVLVTSIFVRDAERDLYDVFAENCHYLPRLVKDERIWHNPNYSRYTGCEVEFPTCLARRFNGDKYEIFDGVHRALGLALRGDAYIYLCYSKSN